MDLKAPARRVFQQPTSIDGMPVTVARISNECDNAIVETELKIAFEMANKCSGQFQSRNPIFSGLLAQYSSSEWEYYTARNWLDKVNPFFFCVARALSDNDRGQCGDVDPNHITCVQDEPCKDQHKGVDIVRAQTDPKTRTINLCKGWLKQADSVKIPCINGKHLAN